MQQIKSDWKEIPHIKTSLAKVKPEVVKFTQRSHLAYTLQGSKAADATEPSSRLPRLHRGCSASVAFSPDPSLHL